VDAFEPFALADLKLVYRVLHGHLPDHIELIDCDLFSDLQAWLHERAAADGVDVTDHERWEKWLGHSGRAFAGRRTLEIVPEE